MADPNLGLFSEEELPPVEKAENGSQVVYVHFEDVGAIETFARLVGQPVTTQTKMIRYPAGAEFSRFWREQRELPDEDRDDGDSEDEREDDGEEGFVDSQPNLFGLGEWWEEYWVSMPEFDQRDLAPFHTVAVEVGSLQDLGRLARLVGQPITPAERRTRSIWYPEAEIGRFADKRYRAIYPLHPTYPVYIISKGRWESRLTAKALERMKVRYRIVIEPQERERYAEVIAPEKIIVLPFSNLGQGSIPARNFVWDHAAAEGHARHWILDDNIDGFFRLNKNLKTPVADGTIFRAAESFVDRYENVALAGFHYFMFASRKTRLPPLTLNTRIYSCILIKNDIPYRWRGRYNEDTDLSLRALKDGWSTVLFSAFLAFKATTMTMSGGNTDELYKDDGRLKMAQSLVDQHPDVAKVTWKWGRWQHHVDYRVFRRNWLRPRSDLVLVPGVNDFGMDLEIDAPTERATDEPRRVEHALLPREPIPEIDFDSWSSLPPPR